VNSKKVKEVEYEIEQLKLRWPGHSATPVLYQQLEELEDRLADAMAEEEDDDGATGPR
jgi:hypothetical protein